MINSLEINKYGEQLKLTFKSCLTIFSVLYLFIYRLGR